MEIISKNPKFKIFKKEKKVYIENFSPTTTFNAIHAVLKNHPKIAISEFQNLKNAITETDKAIEIGYLKDDIEVTISNDKMKAYIKLNFSDDEFELIKESLSQKISDVLTKENVVAGIKQHILDRKDLPTNQKILIAEGIEPKTGEDAKISYYQTSEKKPKLKKDGKVNHYELNLIDNVKKGDWLGEKILATEGKAGKNVTGELIPGKTGRDYNLKFDFKSVEKIKKENENKEILIAKVNGAVIFKNNKISVDNHLIINEDVGYSTGNINFDGHVTINGTIKDNFEIIATKNITINSKIGLGAVKHIESVEGDILIKGGVNGKNVAKIIAGHNIYTKYSNEAHMIAENNIYIGLYAKDSTLRAKNILLDKTNGRIIGGDVQAKYKIETQSIGNKYEKLTNVQVQGFDRETLSNKLKALKISFERVLSRGNKLKRKLEIFEINKSKLDEKALNSYRALMVKYDSIVDEINSINLKIKELEEKLKTKGEGELYITNQAFPKTIIEIKHLQKRLKKVMKSSLYVKDNRLENF